MAEVVSQKVLIIGGRCIFRSAPERTIAGREGRWGTEGHRAARRAGMDAMLATGRGLDASENAYTSEAPMSATWPHG